MPPGLVIEVVWLSNPLYCRFQPDDEPLRLPAPSYEYVVDPASVSWCALL